MPRKQLEIPPAAARTFLADMRAFFATGHNTVKADEIAARQLHALRAYQGLREKKLKLTDVKEMSLQMRITLRRHHGDISRTLLAFH